MNNLKCTFLAVCASAVFFALSPFTLAQAQSNASDSVELTLTLEQPARLSALIDYALTQAPQLGQPITDVHWPTARLLMHSRDEQEDALRERVLSQLNQLAQHQPDIAEHLREQVSQWRLAAQPVGAIEFERARLDIDANPMLSPGTYTLVLPRRKPQVYFFGWLQEPGAYQLEPGQTVREYLSYLNQQGELKSGVSRDHIRLYRSGGYVTDLPWGPHNAAGDELMPGDIVWVGPRDASAHGLLPFSPFNQGLSRAARRAVPDLEDDLATLLSFWVPSQTSNAEQTAERSLVKQQQTGLFSGLATGSNWQRQYPGTLSEFGNHRYVSLSNYGNAGLMQTPTARMHEAGTLAISYTDMKEYRRSTVNLQVFDWLEASAFYMRLPNRLYSSSPGFSGDQILTDKGFDMRIRLWQESYYMPQVVVGLRDFAGTGMISSEYIVASKAYGPFDFSLGLGFGRMGTRDHFTNPFCEISDSFCDRASGFSGRGGRPEYDQWFRGPTALFGGVEYQTPYTPLRVQLEYDSNDYSSDRAGIPIEPRTPWNLGLNYRLNDAIDLRLGYERGDVLSLGVTLRANFNQLNNLTVESSRVPAQEPKAESITAIDWNYTREQLRARHASSNPQFYVEELKASASATPSYAVTMYTSPWRLRNNEEALERSARILAAELPASVERLDIVNETLQQPMVRYSLDLTAYRQQINFEDVDAHPDDAIKRVERVEPTPRPRLDDAGWVDDYAEFGNSFSYGVRTRLNQSFGAPERFWHYQFMAELSSTYYYDKNFFVSGAVGVNLLSNYDSFRFTVDSQPVTLPRVRTFVREYMLQDVWLDRLTSNYFASITPEWHVLGYAGIMERMYGGVGAEVYYSPLDSTWSVGADINRVRQRDFSGGFGFRDYEVTTGHVSVYYDIGRDFPFFEDSYLKLSMGRFLAGDVGANVMFQRRFDSGMMVGAYAAMTNVSSETYGEGSFTKGFFLSIPLDLFTVRPTRARATVPWSPLTRDGGQMLSRPVTLHGLTSPRTEFWNR